MASSGWYYPCPDAILDWYTCPYLGDEQAGIIGATFHDEFSVVKGEGSHNPMTNATGCDPFPPCQLGCPYIEAIAGTNGGTYSNSREWEILGGGGLKINLSFQHNQGPFGNMWLPGKMRRWIRPFGSEPILQEAYHIPWNNLERITPTFVRTHVFIKHKSKVPLPLTIGEDETLQTLHFKFTINIEIDSTLGTDNSLHYEKYKEYLGVIGKAIQYEFTNNVTPSVPSSGTVSSTFNKWRRMMGDAVELVIWVPNEVFIGGTSVPQSAFFWKEPRLSITLTKFERKYI